MFTWLWSIIDNGYGIGIDAINGLLSVIGSYGADVTEITIKLNQYVINLLDVVMDIAGSVVSFLVLLTKFKFVVSIISNKPMTGAFSKIQEYINYFVNFANSNLYEDQAMQQNMQQPMQQQYPQQPMQ